MKIRVAKLIGTQRGVLKTEHATIEHEHELLDTPSGWYEDGVVYQDATGRWWLTRRADLNRKPHEMTLLDDVDKIVLCEVA